jgi:hypothetical protein
MSQHGLTVRFGNGRPRSLDSFRHFLLYRPPRLILMSEGGDDLVAGRLGRPSPSPVDMRGNPVHICRGICPENGGNQRVLAPRLDYSVGNGQVGGMAVHKENAGE